MLARSGGALKVLVLFHTKPKGSNFFLLWDSVLCWERSVMCICMCICGGLYSSLLMFFVGIMKLL